MATKENSLNSVDSGRDELAFLAIQRIDGVLDECIWNVEVLSLLPAIMADLDRLSPALGSTLVESLVGHHLLEKKLDAYQLERPGMPASLEQSFCCYLRTILRHLRACPTVCQELRAKVTAGQYRNMAEGLKELQGLLMEKMLMGPVETRERSRYLKELSIRHRKNMELVSKLEQEMMEATKEKNADISQKDKLIRRLKVSMYLTKKASDEVLHSMERHVEKQKRLDSVASEARRADMQQKVDQLQVQLKNLAIENRNSETILRKKKTRMETEIDNWILKYDADMAEKQAEMEELTKLSPQEQEEMWKLEERRDTIEQKCIQLMKNQFAFEQKQKDKPEVIVEE